MDVIQKNSGFYWFKIKNSEIVDYDRKKDMGTKWDKFLCNIEGASQFLSKLKIEIKIASKEEYVETRTYLL